MPSTSKSQQRLMGQAYALKNGEIKASDLNPDYRKQIQDLADGMTLKQLKDYAETSHKGLPLKKESVDENSSIATVSSVNGMGAPAMPGNPGSQDSFVDQQTGSGDIPQSLTKKQGKKKKKTFMNFRDFIGGNQVRAAF